MNRFSGVVLFTLVLVAASYARLQEQLGLFFEFDTHEVVTKLEQPAVGQLTVYATDTVTGETKVQTAPVPPLAADRLKQEALSTGITVGQWATGPAPVEPAVAEPRPDYLSEPRELRRNRLNYVVTQTAFSYYLYSIALPVAFDADPRRSAALQILSLPAAFGTHYYLARDKDYHDAHLWSTAYFASNSLILSYGASLALFGFNEEAFRAGSFLAAGTYPVALWAGYKHGEHLLDDPGRVQLQSNVAVSAGLTAYLAGITILPEDADEKEGRLLVAGVLGGSIAGHYLSYGYRRGEAVPTGVGTGVVTHTWLGLLVGANLAVLAEPESERGILSLILLGTAAGFGEGLHFFKDKQDSYEQARYNTYGAWAGAAVPIGLALLSGAEPNPKFLMTAVTASAIGGYAITRKFTSHLVDNPRSVKHQGHPGFSTNFIPVPEPYARLDERGETEVAMRFKVPGLTYRF